MYICIYPHSDRRMAGFMIHMLLLSIVDHSRAQLDWIGVCVECAQLTFRLDCLQK